MIGKAIGTKNVEVGVYYPYSNSVLELGNLIDPFWNFLTYKNLGSTSFPLSLGIQCLHFILSTHVSVSFSTGLEGQARSQSFSILGPQNIVWTT